MAMVATTIMIKIYERVSIKTLYLHQLNLYRLITESPPLKKRKKMKEKKSDKNKNTNEKCNLAIYVNVHLKETLRLRLIKKGGFVIRYMTTN